MASKIDSRVKLVNKENGDIISVFPIDAKEIVEQGLYKILEQKETMIAPIDKKEEINLDNMLTKELNKLIEDNKLVIDGFDKMNILEKRQSVKKAMEFINNSDEGDL